jgi:putative transposase
MTLSLAVNQILASQVDGRGTAWRVVHVDPSEAMFGLVRLERSRLSISRRSFDDIEQELSAGSLHLVERPDLQSRAITEARQTSAAKATFEKNWDRIKSLVDPDSLVLLFDESLRSTIVEAQAKEKSTSVYTIRRILQRYLAGGMAKGAVYPEFDRCGARGVERTPSARKRGRPSYAVKLGMGSSPLLSEMNIGEEDRAKLQKGARRFFYASRNGKEKPQSIRRAYNDTRRHYFADSEIQISEDGLTHVTLNAKYPTLRQFKYWGIEPLRTMANLARRNGQNAFDLQNRKALGKPGLSMPGPGYVYQIDATCLDLHLRSRWNPLLPIGRPYLYLVRDWYSTLIVGFAISLDCPSYATAALAMRNAVRNKVELCAEHGIHIDAADWPAEGKPAQWNADRAELSGLLADRLVANTDCSISTMPARRGDFKGLVECGFQLVNSDFAHYEPGAVIKDLAGRRVPVSGAVHTMQTLNRAIIRWILSRNRELLGFESRDPGLDESGVGPVSVNEAFEWGVQNRTGPLRTTSDAEWIWRTYPPEKVQDSSRAIWCRGVRYELCSKNAGDPEGAEFMSTRNLGRKTQQLEIVVDSADVSRAWLLDPRGSHAYRLVLSDGFQRFRGCSREEVRFHLEFYAAQKQLRGREQDELAVDRQATFEEIRHRAIAIQDSMIAAGHLTLDVSIRDARMFEKGFAGILEPLQGDIDEASNFAEDAADLLERSVYSSALEEN